MAILPLEEVTDLQNMWIYPAVVVPQVGRKPRLIFDFTWSGINKIAEYLPPMKEISFEGALLRIIKQVLTADPCIGPVYISKVHLVDAYMRLWVRM